MDHLSFDPESDLGSIGFTVLEPVVGGEGRLVDCRVLYANKLFQQIAGLTEVELSGSLLSRSAKAGSDFSPSWIKLFEEVVSCGGAGSFEIFSEALGRWYKVDLSQRKGQSWTAVCVDISAWKDQESSLLSLKEQFELAIAGSNDGIWDWDILSNKLFLSVRWKEMLGYAESELPNVFSTFNDLLFDEDRDRVLDYVDRYLKGGIGAYEIEFRMRHKDGSLRWILAKGEALRDENGVPYRMAGSHSDVTERKKAEESLVAQKNLYEEILEYSMAGYWDWDVPSGNEYLSPAFKSMFGYEDHEMANRAEAWQTLMFEEDWPKVQKQFDLHVKSRGETPFYNEIRYRHKDGSTVWVICKGKIIEWTSTGEAKRMIGCHIDITERKLAEEALEAERSRLEGIIRGTNAGTWEWNVQTGETNFNRRWAEMIGYSLEEFLPASIETWMNLVHPEDLARSEELLKLHFSGELDYYECQVRMRHKNGDWVWIVDRGRVMEWTADGQPLIMMGTHLDITEAKRQEEDLKYHNNILDALYELSPIGIALNDYETGRFLDVNRKLLEPTGYAKEEFLNLSYWDITPREYEPKEMNALKQMEASGKFDYFEKEYVRKDGTRYPVQLSGVVVSDLQGRRLIWSFIQDISSEKEVEKRLLESREKALSAAKVKSEFLANMSHEIRTPLNGVIGFTDLLSKTDLDAVQMEYCSNIRNSGTSLLSVINDILDLSKIESGKLDLETVDTDILELFGDAVDIIKYHAGVSGLELLMNLPVDLPRLIRVDPVRLKQVIINLLSNAVKFTEEGEVELKLELLSQNNSRGRFRCSVRDTGIGISKDNINTLFEAFSQADTSTTRRFGGTGLGLTISSLLVQKMDGEIKVDSEVGKGSTFFFDFEAEVVPETKDELVQLSVKSVLLIDDNESSRSIMSAHFKHWGLSFTGCSNGADAIRLLGKRDFDLVIVNHHLPYLDGLSTIRLIRDDLKLSPDRLPIILLHSASGLQKVREECGKLGISSSFAKPVRAEVLRRYLQGPLTQSFEGSLVQQPSGVYEEANGSGSTGVGLVILVAEDVALNMTLVKTIIGGVLPAVTILEVSEGESAVDVVRQRKVDLVLMDVHMPGMDGLTATRQIRAWELQSGRRTRIPIIALTAGALKEEREKVFEAGMDDYMPKPIERGVLEHTLYKFLNIDSVESGLWSQDAVSASKHFDYQEFVEAVFLETTLVRDMMEECLRELPAGIELMDRAVTGGDLIQIRASAHAFRGMCLTMRFPRLVEISTKIEENPQSDSGELQKLVEDLKDECDSVLSELKQRLASLEDSQE
ncbi:MAG: PAS domain S-box protein [Opitutales bacterium]|nr:PAS domain S-box protein [Opitutales bacterium]